MKYKRLSIPKPVGNCLLLEVEEDEKKALRSSLIEIPIAASNAHNQRVINSTDLGKVIAIGPDAFVRIHASKPYCLPGDVVLFIQNSGKLFKDEETSKYYRIIKEGDLIAVMGSIGEKEDE